MPVAIKGTNGGSVTLSAAAAAADTTLTLPNTTGTVALTASPTFTGTVTIPTLSVTGASTLTGTVTATTITSPSATALTLQYGGTTGATLDTSGNLQFNSGYGSVATAYGCRAWVNYNGSTPAVVGSGNVSSVTKNGTGDYTINFSSAMTDTNYALATFARSDLASPNAAYCVTGTSGGTKTTSAIRISTRYGNNASSGVYDCPEVGVAIFR